MVPHRGILRAIALIAHFSPNPAAVRDDWSSRLKINFPKSKLQYFWQSEVTDLLPAELETAVRTAQPTLQAYSALFAAAKHLDLLHHIAVDGEGPTLILADDVIKWRQHDNIRIAIEVFMLCDISMLQIAEDMYKMYGMTFGEAELLQFKTLFADSEYATGAHWTAYAECITPDELVFKARLRGEPKDFVRWKLGVPVALDSETVLHRLVSEAYYTERVIKSERRNPCDLHSLPDLDRDDLARLKMERDTIFKGLDRLIKLRELSGAGAGGLAAAQAELKRIIVDYTGASDFPSLDELDA